jgi:hypothetical protein
VSLKKSYEKGSLTLPHAKDAAYPYARISNILYHNEKMIREKETKSNSKSTFIT